MAIERLRRPISSRMAYRQSGHGAMNNSRALLIRILKSLFFRTLGMHQAYHLDKVLRKRYASILPENYYPSLVEVQSTQYARTVMTAQGVMAGMYEPSESQVRKYLRGEKKRIECRFGHSTPRTSKQSSRNSDCPTLFMRERKSAMYVFNGEVFIKPNRHTAQLIRGDWWLSRRFISSEAGHFT